MNPTSNTAPPAWSEVAIAHLLTTHLCPVCSSGRSQDHSCSSCGADFDSPEAAALWEASTAAAEALRVRQRALLQVPVVTLRSVPIEITATTASSPLATQSAEPAPTPAPIAAAATATAAASTSVQSVLAVAGAGLFAIAAIVFTFFNPDLSDLTTRSLVIGAVTLVFLTAARTLARRGLQFSAEAVGALGFVFVALDVQALSQVGAPSANAWLLAAVGTLVGAGVMAVLAYIVRIRMWLFTSALALSSVPLMLGLAGASEESTALGLLTTAAAAYALIEGCGRVASRFGSTLAAERVTLAAVQITAVAVGLGLVWNLPSEPGVRFLQTGAALLAVAVLARISTRRVLPTFWSLVGGASGVAALALVVASIRIEVNFALTAVPAAAVVGLLLTVLAVPTSATVNRRSLTAGALIVTMMSAVPAVVVALFTGATAVLAVVESPGGNDMVVAAALGLGAMSAGLAVLAMATRRAEPRGGIRYGALSPWFGMATALTVASSPGLLLWARVVLALALALLVCGAFWRASSLRAAPLVLRMPLVLGAHLALVLAAVTSWNDPDLLVLGSIAVLVSTVLVASTVTPSARWMHVGAAYAYGLLVFAAALGLAGVDDVARLCLTTSLGALVAIMATFTRRIGPAAWWTILSVTAAPFLAAVAQVAIERSGWTALSTALIFLLALTLVVTRRPGLNLILRAVAAGLLVPSLAVVVICLGAQVLAVSASPVTLPVIAVLVALALPGAAPASAILERRGMPQQHAALLRIAVEASALITATIAIALALVREASGLGTTLLVLVVLGIGGAGVSVFAGRRYGWWVAAASFTGALWCAWGMAGIEVVEPYLLPSAIGAAIVGLVLTARGVNGLPLFATGLVLAVAPTLVVLAVAGEGWRTAALLAASAGLLVLAPLLGRLSPALRTTTLWVAMLASSAGVVQAVRWGLGIDEITGAPMLACGALAIAGAVLAALAARRLQTGPASGRWWYAPSLAFVVVGCAPAIREDALSVWMMWSLMLALLALMVLISVRMLRRGSTSLPPVWFVFVLAGIAAVVAWSPREVLRIEGISLPLGLFLLVAGALHLRAADAAGRGAGGFGSRAGGSGPGGSVGSTVGRVSAASELSATLSSWPSRWTGSWALLAPGLVVVMVPSIAATLSDPQTWRAILVIVMALAAILIGAARRLAAPFLLGIVALPIENVLAFTVQIGRGIESMPWWITLAVVGAVLLIIAVTYERRAGDAGSFTARLRDLA